MSDSPATDPQAHLLLEVDPESSIPLIMNNLANFALEKLNLPALCPSLTASALGELRETVRKFFLNQMSISDFQSVIYQAEEHKSETKKLMERALKEKEMILSLIELAEKKASEPDPEPQKNKDQSSNPIKQAQQVPSPKQQSAKRIYYRLADKGSPDKDQQSLRSKVRREIATSQEGHVIRARTSLEPLQQESQKKALFIGDKRSIVLIEQPKAKQLEPLLTSAAFKEETNEKLDLHQQLIRQQKEACKGEPKSRTTLESELQQQLKVEKEQQKKEKEEEIFASEKEGEKKKPEITEEQSSSKLESNQQGQKPEQNEEKESIVSSEVKKVKCKFYPDCRNKNCKFFHPTTKCEHFPKCKFGANCIYIHPSCKFGSRCNRRDCYFNHPKSTFQSKTKQHVQLIPKALRGIIDDLASEKRKALLKSKSENQSKIQKQLEQKPGKQHKQQKQPKQPKEQQKASKGVVEQKTVKQYHEAQI